MVLWPYFVGVVVGILISVIFVAAMGSPLACIGL